MRCLETEGHELVFQISGESLFITFCDGQRCPGGSEKSWWILGRDLCLWYKCFCCTVLYLLGQNWNNLCEIMSPYKFIRNNINGQTGDL